MRSLSVITSLNVFYCGDDAAAKEIVAGLLQELGTEPIDAGGLKKARFVEPSGMLLVRLAYVQQMGQIGIKLLRR
jgi:8-hydroxy-5-deazaflavin:NADPH oxidoreductase